LGRAKTFAHLPDFQRVVVAERVHFAGSRQALGIQHSASSMLASFTCWLVLGTAPICEKETDFKNC